MANAGVLRSMLMLAASAAVGLLPFVVYFAVNGALYDFFYATVKFNILFSGSPIILETPTDAHRGPAFALRRVADPGTAHGRSASPATAQPRGRPDPDVRPLL
jgi:hypothetical protein